MKTARREAWAAALVACWTAAVFLPALRAGFVDWDDGAFILSNAGVHGLTWANLRWMLNSFTMGPYIPLTWFSLAVDYQLWGPSPFAFHAVNVLLHSLNAVLFFFVSRELLRKARSDIAPALLTAAAAASALAFSIHPLRVESVAWAFERKDVLAGAFYLGAVWAYLRERKGLTLFLFACSLLSKAVGVSLPIVLLALDFYPLKRRWNVGLITEKVPLVVVSAAIAAATYWGHRHIGATMDWASYGLAPRLDQCFYGLAFYARKTLFPSALSPRYLAPSSDLAAWPYLASAAFCAGITLLLWALRRRCACAWTAWFCYVATLLPVSGLIPQSSQIAADRYSYLACMPWAILLGAGTLIVLNQRLGRAIATAWLATTIVALSLATRAQLEYWKDSRSLWTRAVDLEPQDVLARDGLAKALAENGRTREATEQFEAALAINASYPSVQNDYGAFLASQGRIDEALGHFQAALGADPSNTEAQINLKRAVSELSKRPKPAPPRQKTPLPRRSTNRS